MSTLYLQFGLVKLFWEFSVLCGYLLQISVKVGVVCTQVVEQCEQYGIGRFNSLLFDHLNYVIQADVIKMLLHLLILSEIFDELCGTMFY